MKKRRLQTLCDVRRYLANLINRLEADEIDQGKAKTLAYMGNILKSVIESGDHEERLQALEEALLNEGK